MGNVSSGKTILVYCGPDSDKMNFSLSSYENFGNVMKTAKHVKNSAPLNYLRGKMFCQCGINVSVSRFQVFVHWINGHCFFLITPTWSIFHEIWKYYSKIKGKLREIGSHKVIVTQTVKRLYKKWSSCALDCLYIQ